MSEFKEYCKGLEAHDEMENNDFRSDRNYDRLKTVRFLETTLRNDLEKEAVLK